MKGICPAILGFAFLAFSVGALPSCKKREEIVASDLQDAGYQMTPEDWFRASRANDVPVMKKFLSGGFAAEVRDAAGDSALHAAAEAGAVEAADFLLNRGLSIDLRGARARTPLMSAVRLDQGAMVRWLLRQGADPQLKDEEGYKALFLAVKEGRPAAVRELAVYSRQDLDAALLLASLEGNAEVIDALTHYGASVHTRMEDGRTPLMLAAEHGHTSSAELLMDLGASRFTVDAEGNTAADLARQAGHDEIAALLLKEPQPDDLSLETAEEIAVAMESYVEAAEEEERADHSLPSGAAAVPPGRDGAPNRVTGEPSLAAEPAGQPAAGAALAGSTPKPLEGARLAPIPPGHEKNSSPSEPSRPVSSPPLVMRHYRQREMPVEVRSVSGNTATLRIAGVPPREIKIREGESIPGSRLTVVRVQRRLQERKDSPDGPVEVSIVEVKDRSNGSSREWISGVPSTGHDPMALVEDSISGQRYIASPGQRFRGADGTEYEISDVRPNQIVIEDIAGGSVQTIPLSGPRG